MICPSPGDLVGALILGDVLPCGTGSVRIVLALAGG